MELNDTEKAVLSALKNSKMGTDITGKFITLDILELQFGEKRMQLVHKAIDRLIEKDFIENLEDEEDVYRLTPYGKLQRSEKKFSVNNFANISNSNISNNSQNVSQVLRISEQPKEIREKIEELESAIESKDSSAIKKTFGYIADKSIDVAIAILAGNLLK